MRTNKVTKKFLSILLTICMVLAMFPLTAVKVSASSDLEISSVVVDGVAALSPSQTGTSNLWQILFPRSEYPLPVLDMSNINEYVTLSDPAANIIDVVNHSAIMSMYNPIVAISDGVEYRITVESADGLTVTTWTLELGLANEAIPINFLPPTANGISGLQTTTQITLRFENHTPPIPKYFNTGDITLTGAAMGALTMTSYSAIYVTYTLDIFNITVANGEDITVTVMSDSEDFEFTPYQRDVTVYVAPPPSGGGGGGGGVIYYTVTFESGGGSLVARQNVASGNRAIKPADPVRDGFSFTAWHTDDRLSREYDWTLPVTRNTTLYAGWSELISAPPVLTDDHIQYISGYPDGSVRPDNSITRAEAATIFFRLIVDANKNAPLTVNFNDVDTGDWYYQAVAYLRLHNIITGYPDGSFRPNAPISRAEFASIASRFDNLAADVPNIFPDVPDSHWAADNINSAAAKGWVSGFPDGSYRPDDSITRAQVVSIVNRMLDRRIKPGDIPQDVPGFTDISPLHWAYSDIIEASVSHEFIRGDDGYEIWTSFDR